MEKHFDSICGSSIWSTKIVYSSYPDFTPCFHYTILKWTPCLLLWLVAPFWTYMLSRKIQYKLKFSILSFLKIFSVLILILVEFYYLMKAYNESSYLVYYMTPLIMILTYSLVLFFHHYERVRGLRSSSLLFVFWSVFALCSSITFRSKLMYHIHYKEKFDMTEVYIFYFYFGFILINLILTTWSEKFYNKYENNLNELKQTPENLAPLLSKLTFLWIDPLIKKGFKRDLTRADMWEIDDCESSEELTLRLEAEWNKCMEEYNQAVQRPLKKDSTAIYKTTKRENENDEALILNAGSDTDIKIVGKRRKPSLILCLWKVFGGKFLAGTFLKLVQDILSFSSPILLDMIINFIKDKDQTMSVGIFLTMLLFLTSFCQSIVMQHYYFRMYLVGTRIRTALVNMIYKKSLKLSPTARNACSVGNINNLVAVNAQLFLTLIPFLNMIWSSPLQIIICIYMLWRYLGIGAFAGLATTVIFIPLNGFATNLNKKLSVKKLNNQDMRLKIINEILAGIKVIKFYGWEVSFQKIVNKIRSDEMKYFSRNALAGIITSFTWASAPFIVAAVSYATFVLVSEENNLDPSTAFVSLTLFYLIRFPLALLPQTITMVVQGYISLKRIRRLLLMDETNEGDVQHENLGDTAILVQNATLGWNKTEPYLCNLNFEVKKQKIVAVVGSVGSGKSSLVSAILGDMHKINEGKINVNGSVAYVPQQAWIQNATIRENILFGREYDSDLYKQIVSACSLETDFSIMPGGDKTEIGEKGINLSGGQKQRISLARSLYADADIYVLDDPLSAVDSHVGKHIFDKVIGPQGMLKNKTRVFVTNSLSFLPQVDSIIMLEDSVITEIGSYDKLRKNNGSFAKFIKLYLSNNHQNKEKQKKQDESEIDRLAHSKSNLQNLIKQESQIRQMDLNQKIKSINSGDELIIDKDVVEGGTIKLSVLVDYIKKSGILNSSLFFVFFNFSNVALAASSFWLSAWSNDSTRDIEMAKEKKIFRLTIYILLGLLQCVLLNISNIFLVLMYIRAARLYHTKLLSTILRSTLHFFESTPAGRIINRFSRDIESLETSIPDSFKICAFCVSNIIHTLIILAYTTPISLLLILPASVVYIFIQRYYVSSARQLARLDSSTKSPIFSFFSETLAGVSTIRAFNSKNRFIKKMEKNVDENTVYIYTANCAERWLIIRLDFIANLIAALASLFAVFSRNSLSPGLVGLSISLSITVSQALNFFVKMGAEFEANITAVERVKEYFSIPQEPEWNKRDLVIPSTWPSAGKVVLNNFSVKYREDSAFVLRNINAEIMPGEKIGIVGRTGAGKSSLTLALFRLLENSVGDIIIDGINIKNIGLHDLRHKLTIIPQDPVIFSGTIRMNLDPFSKHSDAEIWNALELSHLKDFIMNSDEKLDFKCAEDGNNLSVGQRQLICLARALLRKTKILILDEATASVDHNTDELIQQTIRAQFNECTVLTIAHRLNTILDSSRIMVLDKGNIVEFDSPKKLLSNKSGYFYSMAKDADLVS
uniref:ABC-type glutathione-S-conjugate transporter n=1 Tax=Brachionus rotundiformis TaxID=96890 RepID=A0A482J4R2_9BILA|nr:ABCC1-X8-like protein [Brachionus rotundiformis]QNH67883.1 ATP-binding cassette transporter subfamily C member 1 X8 [Brachionus rotundiformis]